MPLERVTNEAARIVHGTVVDVRSGRDASGIPATWVVFDVARTLKGVAASRLTVKQFGVTEPLPDGMVARVDALPRYVPGDEVVIFLRAESAWGFTSPVGLGQGVYRVSRGGGRARVRGELPVSAAQDLDDLLARVARLVGRGR